MKLPFMKPSGICRVCGAEIEGFAGEFLCDDCSGPHRPRFDRAASAFRLEDAAQRIIYGYKFNGRLYLRDDLVDFLEAAAVARFDVAEIDLVLPMPSTRFRRLDRGYNQCAYLAEALAKRLDRKYDASILRRKGHPKRQAGLDEEERRENAKDSFAVRRPALVRGRTVLVVDDIQTTGATLSAAAEALKAAGAWRVLTLALAKSVKE